MNNWARQRVAKRLVQWAFTTITGLNLGVMVHRIHMINNTTGSMMIPGMMSLGTLGNWSEGDAHAAQWSDDAQNSLDASPSGVDASADDNELQEALQAERSAEAMFTEAHRNLEERLRFGQFSSAGKGKGKCFQCGGDHLRVIALTVCTLELEKALGNNFLLQNFPLQGQRTWKREITRSSCNFMG